MAVAAIATFVVDFPYAMINTIKISSPKGVSKTQYHAVLSRYSKNETSLGCVFFSMVFFALSGPIDRRTSINGESWMLQDYRAMQVHVIRVRSNTRSIRVAARLPRIVAALLPPLRVMLHLAYQYDPCLMFLLELIRVRFSTATE